MAPLATAEVRWFYPGTCPPETARWFDAGTLTSESEERTDSYLMLPGRSDLGVKLRAETFLEIKVRTADHGITHLEKRVSGRVEEWTKWSFPISETIRDEPWRRVEKRRRVRTYAIDEFTGRVTPSEAFRASGEACHAELVAIRIDGADHWSLGFEAVGSGPGDLRTVLAAGISAFFVETPLGHRAFHKRDSGSYPALLMST